MIDFRVNSLTATMWHRSDIVVIDSLISETLLGAPFAPVTLIALFNPHDKGLQDHLLVLVFSLPLQTHKHMSYALPDMSRTAC